MNAYLSKIVTTLLISLTLFFPKLATARYIVRPQDQAVFHNNQGVSFLNAGDAEKALFEFKTATELSPEYTEAWNNLGLTYMFLKDNDQARTALLRAVKSNPDIASSYSHLAALEYNLGHYQEAIEWAEKGIKEDKKFADAYYNEGVSYRELARRNSNNAEYYAKAEKAFRMATEANSRHYLANYELGNIYVSQNKLDEAMMRYKVALEIQPSASQVWVALGNIYLQKGDNNKAQWAFDKGMTANPGNQDAHMNMGLYYLAEKNFTLAERELKQAQQNNPDSPRVYYNLAYLKFSQAEDVRARQGEAAAQGMYQDAINQYISLIQKYPNFPEALYDLAYLYTRTGDLTSAREYYTKATTLKPNFAKAWYGLGLLAYQNGDQKGSVEYFCRFVKNATPDLQSAIDMAQKIIAENGKCK